MATKNENAKVGLNNEGRPVKLKTLTSVIEKKEKNQDLDAEAGVDPQVDQLHTVPDPDSFPKESPSENKKGKSS
ncbi:MULTISPECIES: hypothetical protein [Sphingobacterium]|jgi:hypothetical protein|uniref:hypothetical protein n=1 Tax=Sphingobacterium TaxID=28453 RepID=UPI000C0BDDD8|nr:MULTISPECIES: hypothetical protein [Sphingobacterium]MCT1531715.1 hypothetical protein [Sphingobacterium daejeonense]